MVLGSLSWKSDLLFKQIDNRPELNVEWIDSKLMSRE